MAEVLSATVAGASAGEMCTSRACCAEFTAKQPNAHGTSTPVGDIQELKAVIEAFGGSAPRISSTKSLSGHSLGAAGVQEAIYCLLMMQGDFIAASANIENLDPAAQSLPIVRQRIDNAGLNRVMSNSFGFGGTNASLVLQRL